MTDPYKAATLAYAEAVREYGATGQHALRYAITAALLADRQRTLGYWITRFRHRWVLWVGGWEEPNCGGERQGNGSAHGTPPGTTGNRVIVRSAAGAGHGSLSG